MSKLSATQAAFYGFGLIRRDPLTFAGISVLFVACALYYVMIFLPAYFSVVSTFASHDAASAEVAGALAAMAAFIVIMIPLFMLVLGALNRSFVQGASKGWVLGLKVGMDEVRVIVVSTIGLVLTLLPLYAGVFLGAVIGWVAPGITGALGLLALVAGQLAGLAVAVWIGVRLSFAGPASVAERRLVILESWRMTKGRFWSLLLAYVLLGALLLAAAAVLTALLVGMLLAVGQLTGGDGEGVRSLTGALRSPEGVVVALAQGLYWAVVSVSMFGVAARGYQDWKGGASRGASA